jgi:hypothetical protein
MLMLMLLLFTLLMLVLLNEFLETLIELNGRTTGATAAAGTIFSWWRSSPSTSAAVVGVGVGIETPLFVGHGGC